LSLLSFSFGQIGPTVVDQFSAHFTITIDYSLSFISNQRGYNPPPFVYSPPIQPVQGKLWFSYPTAQARIELTNGKGSPWKLSSTTIVNSFDIVKDEFSFNFSSNVYQTTGPGQCWYGTSQTTEMPLDIGDNFNLTYDGIKEVDGYQSMIWQTPDNTTFAVRLSDLAVVEIDLPYALTQAVPIFSFFGLGIGNTIIQFTDIVVGAPDPSNFKPPTGTCIKVYPTNGTQTVSHSWSDISKVVGSIFKQNPIVSVMENLITKPIQNKLEKIQRVSEQQSNIGREAILEKRRITQGPIPPKLNQTFTARWTLVAKTDLNPPYTPYTLSGKLAFDFLTSGFSWSIDTITGNIPLNLQLELRIHPSYHGVELIQVGPDGNCYSYVFFQWLWTYLVPNFEIPFDAGTQGTVNINGDVCTVYQTTWNWFESFAELFVREKDHVLVQLTIPEPFGHGFANVTLTEIVTSVSPSSYSRPDTCVDTMVWNPSWDSHLPWDWCSPICF